MEVSSNAVQASCILQSHCQKRRRKISHTKDRECLKPRQMFRASSKTHVHQPYEKKRKYNIRVMYLYIHVLSTLCNWNISVLR